MSTTLRGAFEVLLVAVPLLGAGQQIPAAWPKPGQLINEGVALHDKEDYAGAIAKYGAVTPGDSAYATAQSELALSLHSAGKQEEAIAAARRAIALQPFEAQTYNTLANAQDALKQPTEALATYQQALKLFPYNQNLYYNQGVTLLNSPGHTAEALASLQHSVELKPAHPNSHRLLGALAAMQGQSSHALISWLTCLALADAGSGSHDLLVQAERLSQGAPVVKDDEKVKPVAPNSAFEELDQLIESKVALQKSYETKVKFQAAVVKQTQLLVEKFPVDGPADDFWIRAYGPMVAALRQGDNLTTFTYLILQSADDAKAGQWVKANKSRVEAMLRAVMPPLVRLRTQQQVVGGASGQRLAGWFSDKGPEGLGPGINEGGKFRSTGDWISLSNAGSIDATGRYNAAGQRIGIWKVLRPDGTAEKVFTYNDQGEREGPAHEFHPNGQPSFDITYRADKEDGVLTEYNECGARVSTRTFRAGALDGPYTTYYTNGQLHMRATTRADKLEGLQESFFPDGAPEFTATFVNGEKEGTYTSYFPDKTVERKATYVKGERNGPVTEYFYTGAVSAEGQYVHGKPAGTWRTYFLNGKLSVEKSYDEAGELHGVYHDYDETGHVFSDVDYVHGRTVRLRYYDKAGKTVADQAVKKGRVPVLALDENGRKFATGTFMDGQMAGEWQWFFTDGVVREITRFDDKGTKSGTSEFYYHNGQLRRRIRYAPDGNEDGYYEQYTLDGQPATTGYYLAGQRHGQWKDYYANGRVSEEYEYYKSAQNGPARSFEPGGKLTQERLSEFGKLRRLTTFDSTGQVLTQLAFKPDTRELGLRYPSGKPLYRAGLTCYSSNGAAAWLRPDGSVESAFTMLDGRRNGAYKSTYSNGKPDRIGEFRTGQSQGEWLLYYADGQLRKKGRYRDGEEEGEWTSYFPNGQVEWVQHYEGGELHGNSRRYNPAGELLVEKNYAHGALVSFRGPDDKAAFQPLTNLSGPVATTFANGKPAVAEVFDHNLPTGPATFYYASGEVFRRTAFAKGLRTGPLESYYPGGKLMEQEQYRHGELHGRCRYYRPDGTLEREETYRMGERSGPTIAYDVTGKPQQTEVYWNSMVYDNK